MNAAQVLSISGQVSIYLRRDKVLHKNSEEVDGDLDYNIYTNKNAKKLFTVSRQIIEQMLEKERDYYLQLKIYIKIQPRYQNDAVVADP